MAAPKKLGGYELIERLAVGGMAEIFLARSKGIQGFEKEYVLKLIHPKHSGDTDFLRMLVEEAKLTAQLHHTNIAQVIDLNADGNHHFIVMEYIRGKDLFQLLNQAYDMRIPVPLDVCAWVLKETLAGLNYAHDKIDDSTGKPLTLVHRDISPQNIILSWQGEVKVLDFGVAKAAQAARPETQAGIIKGKFRYMSPEQAWGEKLDGRSDMFSAALCLYEMSTSSMAYEDEPDMRKMLVRMREAKFTSPKSFRPDMEPEFEAIIMKGLERRREDRYADCEAFEAALTRYLYKKTPSFTRSNVRQFLASIFPDEAPYAASFSMPDPLTEPVSIVRDSVSEKTDELAVVVHDSGDQTVRRSISGGKVPALVDEFEGGATELFNPKALETPSVDTRSMPKPKQDQLRQSMFGSSESGNEMARPKPIPTAWMPKEVPTSGQAAPPGILSPASGTREVPVFVRRVSDLVAEVYRVINGRGSDEENRRYMILGIALFGMMILSIILLAKLA
jgi:serine/threonine protein kinase